MQKVRWRNSSSLLADAAYDGHVRDPFVSNNELSLGHFDAELDQHDDEDWFNRLDAVPLFLDWEDAECETRLSTITSCSTIYTASIAAGLMLHQFTR